MRRSREFVRSLLFTRTTTPVVFDPRQLDETS
jgi:hypothetical protein